MLPAGVTSPGQADRGPQRTTSGTAYEFCVVPPAGGEDARQAILRPRVRGTAMGSCR
jgi:hypothetical protein